MASMANATMLISVDGVVDPPETEVTLLPSEYAVIDIYSDGTSKADPYFLMISGPGSLDITGATNSYVTPGYPDSIMDLGPPYGILMDLDDPSPTAILPAGTLIDQIIFHYEGPEDVILSLYADTTGSGNPAEFVLFDTQVIHQPEPMTIALLGLGGLFLRRRK